MPVVSYYFASFICSSGWIVYDFNMIRSGNKIVDH